MEMVLALYIVFLWGFGAFRSPLALFSALFGTVVLCAVFSAVWFFSQGRTMLGLIVFISPFAVAFPAVSLAAWLRDRPWAAGFPKV
jgi:hypothetical protein